MRENEDANTFSCEFGFGILGISEDVFTALFELMHARARGK